MWIFTSRHQLETHLAADTNKLGWMMSAESSSQTHFSVTGKACKIYGNHGKPHIKSPILNHFSSTPFQYLSPRHCWDSGTWAKFSAEFFSNRFVTSLRFQHCHHHLGSLGTGEGMACWISQLPRTGPQSSCWHLAKLLPKFCPTNQLKNFRTRREQVYNDGFPSKYSK